MLSLTLRRMFDPTLPRCFHVAACSPKVACGDALALAFAPYLHVHARFAAVASIHQQDLHSLQAALRLLPSSFCHLDTISTGSLATNQFPCVQVTFVFCRRLCSNASIQRPRRYVPTHLACCHTPKSAALHKMANILAVCMCIPPYGFRPLVFGTCQLRYLVHLPKCQPKLEPRAF